MSSQVPPDTIRITLPDGKVLELARGATAADAAAAIGPGLAKAAVGAEVDGQIVDLSLPLETDAGLRILTDRDPEALAVLRHSAAHVLATAVRELHPGAQIGFGPAIEDGFYYDFGVEAPFTPDDLEAFEKEMAKVVQANHAFECRRVTKEEALSLFQDDPLKLERLEEFGDDEVITVYRDGPFLDLCRGPHVPSTGRLQHFKLLSAAGAYWRGDERRQMLQRIYGTAFFKREDLERYLERLEEARKRDHRLLGKELGLFSIQEDVGPGLIFWHPPGAIIQFELRRFIEDELIKRDYQLVYTPHITREALFERSGHLPLYAANQFPEMAGGEGEAREVRYRVKPMNCPMHILLYAAEPRSYRDLPVRLAEVASVYRNERSGTLHGMLRVRGLTMDDAHIFCATDQVEEEVFQVLDLVHFVLGETFGLSYRLDLATRPVEKLGAEEEWDRAEAALRGALDRRGVAYRVDARGGAFYGPKIDVKFDDAIGREWQGATIQLDFQLPERFGLEYIGADNHPHRPVMIHRAIFGTLERFVGFLIEHFAAAFPVWLAPEQVRILPVSEEWVGEAEAYVKELRGHGIRASLAERESLSYRIRDAELRKVPYMGVIGKREAADGTVAVRTRGTGKKQEVMERGAFLERVLTGIRARSLELAYDPSGTGRSGGGAA